ncbi:ACT domain-containing protein [Pseudozobellia sp. WGM2]|uniref:ACT domain-containing protein n=1 Tax=Pseudozobellia sp. WGM2 TaxID=2787625 RepID=UPI001ADFDDC3|nr:ACT domain-containing protein [Pseudozobellia sp. WGM2]
MTGETDLTKLVRSLHPQLNEGEYIFTKIDANKQIPTQDIIGFFREQEGVTLILEKEKADAMHITYGFIASWISLQVHSSLEAVGLTAVFATELAKHAISCNVVAGFHHDHIFVSHNLGEKAIKILTELSENYTGD